MKRQRFAIVYTTVFLVSLTVLSLYTANYLEFFPALGMIQTTPTSQLLNTNPQTNLTLVQIYFAITNPTGFSGLQVQRVDLQLYFTAGNNSLFQNLNIFAGVLVGAPLGPGGVVHANATFSLDAYKTSNLTAFRRAALGKVSANYVVDIHLTTFLEAIAGLEVVRNMPDLLS